MTDENKKPTPGKNPITSKNPKARNNIIIIATLVLVVIIMMLLPSNGITGINKSEEPKPFSDLISEIKNSNVSKITVSPDKETFDVEIFASENKDRGKIENRTYSAVTPLQTAPIDGIRGALSSEEDNQFKLGTGDGEIIFIEEPKSWLTKLFESPIFQILIQVVIIAAIALFILRQIAGSNSRNMQFGNSKAKLYDAFAGKKKIMFDDVAGNAEAKQELTELVDFLKRPEEYTKMGAKIPRGALLIGQPGNGKTLLARAVAGEAKVPFFFVSGSEFVEMFVGVGAGRVRDLFNKAKKSSPCVIFIDEIDAVGRKRGSGMGNSNDEREQTLNQILVEMDGFEENESVIVLAATNRVDVLDKALLRPGRFDRQITVTAPDTKEREKILKVHAIGKKLAKDADLSILAKRTSGFSGADLANIMNEAAILAVREKKKTITNTILREAIEKTAFGPSLKSKFVTEDQKKLTAYHEAAHALVACVLPEADRVQKISIIPRGKAGGYTFTDRGDNDPLTIRKSKFEAEIAVLYAGYIVEQMYFGEPSTGPSNDLERATDTARRMVTKFGMSSLGPVNFTEMRYTPDGMEYEQSQMFSDETNKKIDLEIQTTLEKAYKVSEGIIKKYKKYLEDLANALIENEVLEYEEFNEIVIDIASKKS